MEPVVPASGYLRLATESDRPLLLRWFTAFNFEIDGVVNEEIKRRVDVELKRQSTYLWEDGVPVSMAGSRQFSPTAARIAPVYTPPEYRRKGYATACVAALSQKLLNRGCDRCFLFTDLANPTSNRIYQQVGHRSICDWHEYSFTERGEGKMMNLDQYDYYLVLDLEATCCDKGTIKRHEMEIIEIGAVIVEAPTLTMIDEFQTFIKPVRHPILTEFCQSLTSITQSQVDQAPGYVEAIALLQKWLSNYPNAVFGSWGDYDRKQFKQDSFLHNVPFPIAYPHVNLKQLFSDTQGLPKRYGMAEALQLAGIELEGTHHRGIDDARNIAKLLPFILGRQQLNQPSTA